MLTSVRNFKTSQVLPRMLADFALVQICMIMALGIPVVFLLSRGDSTAATARLEEALSYYVPYFLCISVVFPLVFLVNGFYTRSRAYSGRYKMVVVMRGAGVGILTLLAVNYLFFRGNLVPRLALLFFAVFTVVALSLTRLAKALLTERYEIRARDNQNPEGTVLVLGGAGYIGSSLVRKLLESGRKVRVVDSLVYGDEPLRGVFGHPNLEMRIGDCRNIQDMVAAVRGADSVFGLSYRPRFDLVVNLLMAKAYNEGVITIFNGEQWRPFIHVHDVAAGIIRTLNAPLPIVSGQIFNLGDTHLNYTLTQVSQLILKMFPDTRVQHIEDTDRRNYRVSFDK